MFLKIMNCVRCFVLLVRVILFRLLGLIIIVSILFFILILVGIKYLGIFLVIEII